MLQVRSAFNEVYNNFTPHNLTQWCDSILQYKYERAEGNVEHFLLMVGIHIGKFSEGKIDFELDLVFGKIK